MQFLLLEWFEGEQLHTCSCQMGGSEGRRQSGSGRQPREEIVGLHHRPTSSRSSQNLRVISSSVGGKGPKWWLAHVFPSLKSSGRSPARGREWMSLSQVKSAAFQTAVNVWRATAHAHFPLQDEAQISQTVQRVRRVQSVSVRWIL